jgi:large subunit ribosomal protein L10
MNDVAVKKGRTGINPRKAAIVEETVKMINEYPIFGLADLKKLPAAALQNIKMKMGGKAKIAVIRKKLLKFALEKAKPEMVKYIPEQPALVLTKENPFMIYKFIQQNKSSVSAKVGDIAEDEITVSAGPTDLMPGPALTTLSSAKIKAKVEGGKIAIIKDITIAKAGDEIDEKIVTVLSMLKMKPMKVALNVTHMLENGTIYDSDLLFIDDAQTLQNIATASGHAFNLAVEAGYPTSETIEFIISKAFNEAKGLCVEANIISKEFIGDILAKAVREANALPKVEVGEVSKEEPKAEAAEGEAKPAEEVKEDNVQKDNNQEKKEEN